MSNNQRVSLSAERRVILVFVLSALAGIVLVGGALRYFLQRAALAQCRTNLESMAGVLARQCESEMADAQRDLEFISKMPAFQQLSGVDQIDPAINGVPENVEVEKRHLLAQLMNKSEPFSVLFILRPNGDIYLEHPYKTQLAVKKYNLADRLYFQEAVRTKKTAMSDSLLGAGGMLGVAILVPILSESGEVTSYLGAFFYLSNLSQLVNTERIRPFDAGFIVDRKGQLIAHTDTALLQGSSRERFIEHHPLLSGFLASGGSTTGAGQRAVLFGECLDPADSQCHLSALVPLSSGWGLGLMRDRASVIAETRPAVWGITSLAALLLALIGGLGVAIAHGIGRRWDSAERALRASEADLRTTLTSIGDGVISTDTERRITRLNDAAAVLTGWTPQDAVGLALDNVFKIVNEDTREPAPDPVARVLASGQIEGLANHSVLIARDDAERAIADSAAPIRDPGGDILGVGVVFRGVSDERRAAEALRASEERFRIAAETSNDAVYEWDLKQSVQWLGKIDEMLGYGPGEFPRTLDGWAASVHPEDLERVRAAVQAHLEGHAVYDEEYRVRTKDGAYRWWEARGAASRTPDGRPVGWIGSVTDITERKQVEEVLRDSEERFRATFEQAAAGIAQVGLNGRWLRVNQRLCDIVGYTGEELLALTFQDITHPDDLSSDLAFVRQVLAGEIATYSIDKRYLRKDRSLVWVNLTVGLVRDDAGTPKYFVSVVKDITARKRAEVALKTSEERFRTAVESLTDVVYDWDIKEKVDWYGDIDGIMGYPPGGFPRTIEAWAATIHPEDKDRVMAALEGHLKGVAPYVVEYRVGRRDGEWRWWSARGTALRDDRGEPCKMVGSITDITERKRVAEALRTLTAELEQRVQDRTVQLEAANKELEAFSYSVSHDLRAPLRAIDGYGRILVEDHNDRLDPEGRRVLGVISIETRRMGQLIDDLLAFSRLGRQKLESSNINMTALAQAIFEEQAAQAPKRALQLELKPLPPAYGDRAMIRVVLGDLLSNAIKFTKHRDPAVIEIGGLQEDGQALYYVKDNGVGFDMKYAPKLFGVFQRLHSTEEFEGTGVGLALVQRVIHRHGGRVWAEGKVNEGAVFYFSLKGNG